MPFLQPTVPASTLFHQVHMQSLDLQLHKLQKVQIYFGALAQDMSSKIMTWLVIVSGTKDAIFNDINSTELE